MIPRDVLPEDVTLCEDGAVTVCGIIAGILGLSAIALLNFTVFAFILLHVIRVLRPRQHRAARVNPQGRALAQAHR